MDFVISTNAETHTRGKLLARFYKRHKYATELWGQKGKQLVIARPISMVMETDGVTIHQWRAIYHEGYFVLIDEGEDNLHVAKLYLATKNGAPCWLGTAQIQGHFLDEMKMRRQLRYLIRKRGFYISESSAEELISLAQEVDLYSEALHKESHLPRHGVRGRFVFVTLPRLTCPICKKKLKSIVLIRRHFRFQHPRKQLVIWHRPSVLAGITSRSRTSDHVRYQSVESIIAKVSSGKRARMRI